MARSEDQTRRDFLVRLARTAAFVPPLMATVGVRPLLAGGKGGGGGNGGGSSATASTIGSLSPTANVVSNPTFNIQAQTQSTAVPWGGAQGIQPPPWSSPPPTQTGR